uniref:uncharacterized protein LOC104266772 n=1 Tax=Ciona intestinalis TaxID=7719 RepID=UPI000521A54C|nr:uncharacterized protein LOC104266772 [Ciona intestinalis]|eukprot:XP_009862066.1 uncharacterized protein LOC104266772 [Ciona intestinalis]
MSHRGSQASIHSFHLGPYTSQPSDPLPEEWTLVGEHKMEKREPFQLWHTDLQANILNCARKLNCLLERHPHPNAHLTQEDYMTSRYVIEEETDRVMTYVYYGRQPQNVNPAFYHLDREHEIRQYRGL